MASVKNNGPIIDPALCRCCRAIKKCRVLTAEYTWMEKKEVYADMVMDCFGVLVSKVMLRYFLAKDKVHYKICFTQRFYLMGLRIN